MKLSLDGDLDHMIRGKPGDRSPADPEPGSRLDQDQHAVAEAFGLLHEMGCQDDGFPLPVDVLDPLPDHAPALGIQSGGQLIQHEQLRIMDQGQGEKQALLLPSREVMERVSRRIRGPPAP